MKGTSKLLAAGHPTAPPIEPALSVANLPERLADGTLYPSSSPSVFRDVSLD